VPARIITAVACRALWRGHAQPRWNGQAASLSRGLRFGGFESHAVHATVQHWHGGHARRAPLNAVAATTCCAIVAELEAEGG